MAKNRQPDDDAGQHTEMLKVEGDEPAPPPKRKAAPVEDPNDAPGATAFLAVEKQPAPKAKKRAPTIEEEPPADELPPPMDEDAQPTLKPMRRPAPAPAPSGPPARRPSAPPARPAPQKPAATEFLDIRNVPTPEEMRQQQAKKAALAQRKKMPEEIEVPVEHLHEQIHESAHGGGHAHAGGFNMWVALSSALLAVLAALSALMSGHWANEAMIEQIRSSDQWAFFQAKSIKSAVLQAKMETLQGMGRPVSAADQEKLDKYEAEQQGITKKAKELESESHHFLNQHQVMARTVTLMQIAIALAAIAVLTKKRLLWYLSLAGGAVGAVILVQAFFFTH